jgi:carboxylate-amine ligase
MRVMDMPMNLKHTLGMVALTQSLVSAISEQIDRGAYLYDSHPMIAKQNKWHAGRYGMDAQLVDFDTMQAVPARTIARRMIDLVSSHADRLGCLSYLHHLDDIIDAGTGAQRQRRVFDQTGDLRDVVKYLVEQGRIASGTNPQLSGPSVSQAGRTPIPNALA